MSRIKEVLLTKTAPTRRLVLPPQQSARRKLIPWRNSPLQLAHPAPWPTHQHTQDTCAAESSGAHVPASPCQRPTRQDVRTPPPAGSTLRSAKCRLIVPLLFNRPEFPTFRRQPGKSGGRIGRSHGLCDRRGRAGHGILGNHGCDRTWRDGVLHETRRGPPGGGSRAHFAHRRPGRNCYKGGSDWVAGAEIIPNAGST
jgi:hypothetical protein